MAQVSIVMGSDSDMPVMAKAAEILLSPRFPAIGQPLMIIFASC